MNGQNDYIDLLVPADECALRHRILDATAGMGFDKVVLAVLPAQGVSFGAAHMWSNCDPEWERRYRERSFDLIDPLLRHCFKSRLPLIWAPDFFEAPAQREFHDEASAYGLNRGITLPLYGLKGEVGMLTCAVHDACAMSYEQCLRCLPRLSLLRDITSEAIGQFGLDPKPGIAPRLSRRETECLRWHAVGKTSWEIGHILNVSESCINFHFNNIRRKFNVSRRHEAVLKAIEWGLLSVGDMTAGLAAN
ncbi:LuxR family transcriptional regulator [Paraburkholderia sp. D15]|uniref:LuxR family transcriptional regulator n=1 Tax=Paraburkholderia sp. D15 TaxID=2880218 RepID=UPI0024795132|nr:LuxR family transcriptional regulator [Paraburkholderia sp. D15]WGS51609.1 LuxR family transcriptional regulator [Paraburkholderia sp. D15]WKF55812.1 Transcriptional activator protein LasR [Paraburkholderia busanensis]